MGDGQGPCSGEKAPSHFFPILTHPSLSCLPGPGQGREGISEALGPQGHTTSQGGTSVEDVGS